MATLTDVGRLRWPTRAAPVAVAMVTVAGVVARFATTSPLWLDEALSVNIASLDLGEIPEALRRDGHPPLYYWLLHLWMELVGDSDLAVRALSGVLAVATLPLAWLAGGRLGGRRGARWAVVVLALSPYAVRYATEARMYALVMLLVTAGYLLLDNVLRGQRGLSLAGLSLVAAGLLWSHYWSVYLLGATGLVLLVRWWARAGTRSDARAAIAALVAGGLLFLPWLPSFLDQTRHTGTPWALPSRPTVMLDVTLADLGGGGFAEARLYGVAVVIALVVAVFGQASGIHEVRLTDRFQPETRDEVIVVVLTLAAGAVAGYASSSAYASRYASVVVPLVLLLAAVGLTRLRGWLLVGLAAAVLVFGVVGSARNVVTDRTQSGRHAAAIAAGATGSDVVVACPDQLAPALARALADERDDLTVVPYPTGDDPRFVDWRDYAERNAAADPVAFAEQLLDEARGAIWVVWGGTYRSLEGHCEALLGRLGAQRPTSIEATPGAAFEASSLYRVGPP